MKGHLTFRLIALVFFFLILISSSTLKEVTFKMNIEIFIRST